MFKKICLGKFRTHYLELSWDHHFWLKIGLFKKNLQAPSELLLSSAKKSARKAGLARPVSSNSEGARWISKWNILDYFSPLFLSQKCHFKIWVYKMSSIWYEKVPCQIWGVFIFECNFEIILAPLWSCNFAQCWIVNHGCSFGSVSAWSLKVRELKWLFSELSNIWSAQPEHVNVAKKNTFDLMFWVKCFFFATSFDLRI